MNQKGDFTAEARLLWISSLALVIGALCAFVAKLLLWLIAFFTNLFYYQQLSLAFHSPADAVTNHLGLLSILIPALGGLIIGLMARADDNPRQAVGIITRSDLLKPRARQVEEEATRRRFIDLGMNAAREVRS
jgi:CIC family chloride channel protein